MADLSRSLLATCVAAAAKAGEFIRERSANRANIVWEEKSRADFVSDVDRGAEQLITALIRERHPDAAILGEELSPHLEPRNGVVFVADPLDGTTNFLHDFPWYAVSIAAMVDGKLTAGAVLNVPNGELFTAVAGSGARRNGVGIKVSPITEPLRALIGTGMPFKHGQEIPRYLESLQRLMLDTAGIRRPGSAALDLCDVACGRFEAFWELKLAPWDIAAGILIVREAGGIVTDLEGTPAPVTHTGIVAGNPVMHAWLLSRVRT